MPKQKPKKRLPAEVVEKIIADYQSGMSLKKVAEVNNVSPFYARQYLDDYIRAFDKSWQGEVVERYLNGAVCVRLAEEYGITTSTLSKYLLESGATKEKKRRMMESFQPVIKSWHDGLTEPQLLEKYPQFSKNNIHHIVNKFCPKRREETDFEEVLENLPKAEPKETIRFVRVERKVYRDITDMIAGV